MHVHRLKSFGCIVILAALSALEGEAASQPILSGEEAAKLADAYFLRGKALIKEGNIKEAYKQYKAAWDLKKSYDIAANLGNVEYQLGMPRDAAEHLSFSVRNAAVSVTSDRLDAIKKLLDQARALVGGAVVKVSLDGADILIDGELVGRSPVADEIFVDPGPRTIEARLPGYEPAKQTVEFARAKSQTITLTLKPAVIPKSEGTVSPPSSATAIPTSPPAPRKSLIPVGVGAGVAAAGLGLGVASVFMSNKRSADADKLYGEIAGKPVNASACTESPLPDKCAKLNRAYMDEGLFRNLAIVGFATAGVATLATITYALIPASSPPTTGRVRASFSAGADGGGLMIHGSF
jgi:tetratricopeptide (TPR) repeat protein